MVKHPPPIGEITVTEGGRLKVYTPKGWMEIEVTETPSVGYYEAIAKQKAEQEARKPSVDSWETF